MTVGPRVVSLGGAVRYGLGPGLLSRPDSVPLPSSPSPVVLGRRPSGPFGSHWDPDGP